MLNVLILSNMGPSVKKPTSGLFVYNQVAALRKFDNLNVEFFFLKQDEKHGLAKLLRYPFFFFSFVKNYVFSLKKLDIIHVHFYYPTVLLAVFYQLIRNPRIKIVVTFHGSDIYSYLSPNLLYRFCSRFVDKYIFVSQSLKKSFFKSVPAEILCAGASDHFYYHERNTVSKCYDLLFVGHLNANKGVDKLIAACRRLGADVTVAIVGEGNTELLSGLSFAEQKHIHYLGSKTIEELVELYEKSRFLINLSKNESFGLVMTEAMALGTPVIATKTDGSIAQIEHGINGFLLNEGDLVDNGALANQIARCLTIEDLEYTKFSLQAKNSADKYRLSTVVGRINEIYQEVITK